MEQTIMKHRFFPFKNPSFFSYLCSVKIADIDYRSWCSFFRIPFAYSEDASYLRKEELRVTICAP